MDVTDCHGNIRFVTLNFKSGFIHTHYPKKTLPNKKIGKRIVLLKMCPLHILQKNKLSKTTDIIKRDTEHTEALT